MNTYFLGVLKYDYWATLTVLEHYLTHPSPPRRGVELMSHLVAAQRIWIDRLHHRVPDIHPWERFADTQLLDLLEMNYRELGAYLQSADLQELVRYRNTKGEEQISEAHQIFTHLTHHASYHRGQLVAILRLFDVPPPATSFIDYTRC